MLQCATPSVCDAGCWTSCRHARSSAADEGDHLRKLGLDEGVRHTGLAVLNLDRGAGAEGGVDGVPRVECQVHRKDWVGLPPVACAQPRL